MTVEVLSTLERKISFNVSKEVVSSQVSLELRKYAKDAKIQGFRPGKAPKIIVEQMYGGRAYEDALNKEINKKLFDLIVESKLNTVGDPKVDLTSSEGEEFTFSAVFEVMPEVKLGDLSNHEVEKPTCSLSDEDIQKTIDNICKQRASYTEGLSAAKNDDRITIDFVGTVDGVEFDGGKASDYPFVLGKGWMLPDFENGVTGMKPGESKEVSVNFPEEYHAENLKGKTALFTITVKKIEEQNLPEMTEEFIKSLGVSSGTVADLHKEVKENLQREIDRRLKLKSRSNAIDALLAVSPLEVPNTLVHDEIHHMMKNAEENMKQQGYKPNQINLTHEMFEKDARKMVALRMLVQEFIKINDIKNSDDDVRKVVEDLASMYEDPAEYVSWYFQDQQRVMNAKAMSIEQKVTESIFAKAKTKETTLSYEEVMSLNS